MIDEVIRSMVPPGPLAVTRRIVARAKIPPNEQFVFDGKLRNALAEEWITRYGQEHFPVLGNGGQSIEERNGQVIHTYQSSSRRNYVIDGIQGMALISLIGEEDSITAFVVLTEVPWSGSRSGGNRESVKSFFPASKSEFRNRRPG